MRRPGHLAVVVGLIVIAVLTGCAGPAAHPAAPSRSGSAAPTATVSPPVTTPLPSLSLQPGALPPKAFALAWTTTKFDGQARLEWHLPKGTTDVDAFRIRYLVNGRQKIVETEYFFNVLTGLHPGDEVRAFVLSRAQTGNSEEVGSPLWTQP